MDEIIDIAVLPGGRMQFIYDDRLSDLLGCGEVTIRRASHVEPDENGLWVADMGPVGGPKLPPQRLRSDALALETEWLRNNYIGKED